VITSPPYEGSLSGDADSKGWEKLAQDPTSNRYGRKSHPSVGQAYSTITSDNIGNLKSQSYLEAMALVYSQCYKVLKPQGLMILVTKNFIRNKKVIRLDTDTIKLCEQAGFKFVERHYRKLPSQSFWRIIYQKKFPDVPTIDYEDILVFQRSN
jgi:DNA modification methylase